jgi:hypothetical protein
MRESVRPGTDGGDFVIVEKASVRCSFVSAVRSWFLLVCSSLLLFAPSIQVFGRLKAPYASARDEIVTSIAAQGPLLERIITANTAYAAARESDGSFLQRQEMLQRINKGVTAYAAVRSSAAAALAGRAERASSPSRALLLTTAPVRHPPTSRQLKGSVADGAQFWGGMHQNLQRACAAANDFKTCRDAEARTMVSQLGGGGGGNAPVAGAYGVPAYDAPSAPAHAAAAPAAPPVYTATAVVVAAPAAAAGVSPEVQQLVDMGFAPDLAMRALSLSGGDLSAAAIKLAYGEVQ